ncbi:hypothetical protein KOR42_36410 [Thalassoglobus neptunius]|uniref:TENA/THI-4/PQQC family protein n=1 Tax=Thalassoglobus neptunius TaxID=1938619 RepID=A0A5C5WJ18_9PLAN|nr:hypothetical protein [Thalassoglobus neptunius]TWT50095.1 hypothetical protein KOR42_36410 [Thalassoglobus neptunius]
MNKIRDILREATGRIGDHRLAEAVNGVYESSSSRETILLTKDFWDRLTTNTWPQETLRFFASGWHDLHQSAFFVAGLQVRLQRDAASWSPEHLPDLIHASSELAEIISEDTGVDGTPHDELYRNFARSLTGDDLWSLDRYTVPACKTFRIYVRESRLSAPISNAILAVAASEQWNTAEYSLCSQLMKNWQPSEAVHHCRLDLEYVDVHAGETELGHLLHALNAWRFFLKTDPTADQISDVSTIFQHHIDQVKLAYLGLHHVLDNTKFH